MDNQQPVIAPTTPPHQPVQLPQESAPVPPPPTAPVQTAPKKDKGGGIFVLVVTVLLMLAAGALGYLYKTTNDSLKEKSQELSKAYQTVEQLQTDIDSQPAQLEKEFIWQNNTEELSRSMCGGKPVLMSDVHLTDNFGVFRYLCAELDYATPIRVGALKKLQDGSYEGTYGASTLTPNNLPGYIFDEDPEFFSTHYGVTRF